MKRYSYLFCGMLILAAMTSCNQDEPQKPVESQSYTMTIQATKGFEAESPADGSVKRALSLDGHTLTASWAKGERVRVFNTNTLTYMGGYLEAQTTGTSTTLSGTLTGIISEGDPLMLEFLSPSYSEQDGTLDYISTHCDYAQATATVASVVGGNITTTGPAAFENKQAIVKFTLKKSDGSDLPVTSLTVSDGTNNYTVTPASATNVLFIALRATNTVILTSDLNGYRKTNANLVAGKYYEITVKMSPRLAVKHAGDANYTAITGNTTLVNGDFVTGTLVENHVISIYQDAAVTLSDVTINGGLSHAGITCQTNATITLAGTNTIQAPASGFPGIQVGNGTLTINGSGSLTVAGGADAAGIGCGPSSGCGNIRIEGGTIDATGGNRAASIGSGYGSSCGDITINGTHSVTLNNPNNSGFPVNLRTFMGTGGTIYLAQMVCPSSGSIAFVDDSMIEDSYYHVEYGCLTAQQFVYRPKEQ